MRTAFLLVLLGAAGCGDDEGTSGSGGGGSTGSTGSNGTADSLAEACDELCDTLEEVDCVTPKQTEAQCEQSCASSYGDLAYCVGPVATALECIADVDSSALTCNANGELQNPAGCNDAEVDYLLCACYGSGGDASKAPDPATYCTAYCDKQKDLPCADDAACRANCANPPSGQAFNAIAATLSACLAASTANAFVCNEDGDPVVDGEAVPAECRSVYSLLLGCAVTSVSACSACAEPCGSTLCGPGAPPDAACLACVRPLFGDTTP